MPGNHKTQGHTHCDGAEAVAAAAGGAVDALHGAGGGKHVRNQEPIAAKLVHNRAQQPLLFRAPGDALPAGGCGVYPPVGLQTRAKSLNISSIFLFFYIYVRLGFRGRV